MSNSNVYNIIYVSSVHNQSQYIMNSLLLLCQRTPIATCNRRIPYYAYFMCQSGSYVIETNRLETLSMLEVDPVHTWSHGLRRLALNQAVSSSTIVTVKQ